MAPPKSLFSGAFVIDYRQFYVEPDDGQTVDLDKAYLGSLNGLCGASDPGRLFLTTGTQSGEVKLSVLLFDEEPELDLYWEDVVEVSLTVGPKLILAQWDQKRFPLAVPPGTYRVRYCAKGMDEEDTDADDPPDIYCLQFWPGPIAPDAIVRTTTKTADFWHKRDRVRG